MDGIKTVADRFEGDLIVCVDDETGSVRHLSRAKHPDIAEGDVLYLTHDQDNYTVTILKEETNNRRAEASNRLQSLFRRTRERHLED